MDNENKEKKGVNKTYVAFAVIFVLALVLLGIASSYAYYKLNVENSSSKTNVIVETDCIDVSFVEQASEVTNGFTYNYPITDEFALGEQGVKPITLRVKNNCTKNTGKVPYVLTLSSIHNVENNLEDSKVRYQVKKQTNSDTESIIKTTNYLNMNDILATNSQAYTLLEGELANKEILIKNTTPYIIDFGELDNNDEIIYSIYLWVDYYEGDSKMYEEGPHTHDSETYDNSTKNTNFKTISSILINTSTNSISGGV